MTDNKDNKDNNENTENKDNVIDLKELVSGLSKELLAEMEKIKAGKSRGGKDTIELSDTEKKHITQLVGMCLLGNSTQTDIVNKYRELKATKTDAETKDKIRKLWFAPINERRSFTSFRTEFVAMYQDISDKLAKQQQQKK